MFGHACAVAPWLRRSVVSANSPLLAASVCNSLDSIDRDYLNPCRQVEVTADCHACFRKCRFYLREPRRDLITEYVSALCNQSGQQNNGPDRHQDAHDGAELLLAPSAFDEARLFGVRRIRFIRIQRIYLVQLKRIARVTMRLALQIIDRS